MPFRKVTPETLPRAVVRQVEHLILHGVLRPGDRLPPERDLAERLGVSRPSLREAVAELSEAGLLVARAGAGVYVADVLGSAFSPALTALLGRHEDAILDHVAFRRDVEGLAAARAAREGSDADLAVVAAVFARMEASDGRDPVREAALDAEFHMALVEASHNVVMLHVMRSIQDLLREGVAQNRAAMFAQRTTRAALTDQHRAIRDALLARDPEGARAAVEAHLDFVRATILARREAEGHEATARLRLAQRSAS